MSSVVFDKRDLFALLKHHIAILERFGLIDEEPFSLIYFSLKNSPKIDHAKTFQAMLRKTDALFQDKTNFVALLPGTDWNGANIVLEGIYKFLDEEYSDNIATFPDDGEDAKEIINSLHDRIVKNLNIGVKMLEVE